MTTRIGAVWDSTAQVLAGRGGMVARIALASLFVPAVLQGALGLLISPRGVGAAIAAAVFSLAVALAAIWGQLAITAVASDPATRLADAARGATRRLPAAVGVAIVITVAAGILALPIFIAIGTAVANGAASMPSAVAGAAALPRMSGGTALFVFLYGILCAGLVIWAGARLLVTYAVVMMEARSLGAIGRSIALTRGATWRLVGVMILFGVVVIVATLAAQAVVGTIARLLMGAAHVAGALFVAGIAGSAVATALTVVAIVFIARFYVAAREAEAPPTPAAL